MTNKDKLHLVAKIYIYRNSWAKIEISSAKRRVRGQITVAKCKVQCIPHQYRRFAATVGDIWVLQFPDAASLAGITPILLLSKKNVPSFLFLYLSFHNNISRYNTAHIHHGTLMNMRNVDMCCILTRSFFVITNLTTIDILQKYLPYFCTIVKISIIFVYLWKFLKFIFHLWRQITE